MAHFLPEDVWCQIFRLLDRKSLANASLVCKKWLEIIRNDSTLSGYTCFSQNLFGGRTLKPEDLPEMLKSWPKIQTLELDEKLSKIPWDFSDEKLKETCPLLNKIILNFEDIDGQLLMAQGGKGCLGLGIKKTWQTLDGGFKLENTLHLHVSPLVGDYHREIDEVLAMLDRMKQIETVSHIPLKFRKILPRGFRYLFRFPHGRKYKSWKFGDFFQRLVRRQREYSLYFCKPQDYDLMFMPADLSDDEHNYCAIDDYEDSDSTDCEDSDDCFDYLKTYGYRHVEYNSDEDW